ncbi:MAG: GrpB family protein [Clostridiales bacterium]|nr:GrpB family protein [Clostridiales bacterium]
MEKKRLSEMTLEELWELFPIFLTEHNPCWVEWYSEEIELLKNILPLDIEYHHVGSTAVEGIFAKPIIDILIVVNSVEQMKEVADMLRERGYIVMSANADRISLNKGYTENGFAEKVFHLHIRLENDKDEIYFRDYLNAHPEIAQAYVKLKLRLWKKYEHDRDGYTAAKTEFVKKYTELAKKTLL